MKVLVACEESQRVCIAFRKKGHRAFSCDIEYCSGGHPEWHIRTDVLRVLNGGVFVTEDNKLHNIDKWDLIIAHPPCTYLSNAGARFLYPKGELNQERYKKGLEAKEFFMKLYNANCPKIAVENPVSSKIYNMPKYTQEIQPFEFGHPIATILFPDGYSESLGAECLKKDKFVKKIDWWNIHDEYINEANMYLKEQQNENRRN